jgi:hypothetical protein
MRSPSSVQNLLGFAISNPNFSFFEIRVIFVLEIGSLVVSSARQAVIRQGRKSPMAVNVAESTNKGAFSLA